MHQLTPKQIYLKEIQERGHKVNQTSSKHHMASRQRPWSREREVECHAKVLEAVFGDKLRPQNGWANFLDHVAEDPNHSYAIPGHVVTEEARENQYMLALLAGQASGKSALIKELQQQGLVDEDKSVTISTSKFLNILPETAYLDSIDDKENAIARVRNELLYLQRLCAEVATANGIPIIFDVHIIEDEQSKALTDIARKNEVPSILITPHVSLETYGRRVCERTKKEGRAAFKDEHILFHEIFADNFTNHFRKQFDLSMVLDNNLDVTPENVHIDDGQVPFKPIYRAMRAGDKGKFTEEVLDEPACNDFMAKRRIHPLTIQHHIKGIIKEGPLDDGKIDEIQSYLGKVSKGISDQQREYAKSSPAIAEREAREQGLGHIENRHFRDFIAFKGAGGELSR